MDVIAAQALVKEFKTPWGAAARTVRAVAALDLAVPKGRIFGLLGPNGSGKTTTILMILGLLRPTAGRVSVLGVPAGHPEARRFTGYLPEETRLYEFLTGEETLDFVGRLFGMKRADRKRRTAELLERTGMWDARKRTLATYSKGMARRIGLAQALLSKPQLVVLDEPTSGLDPVGNREVRDLLRDVAAGGTTILLTSHILGDVAEVCDRIAILHAGRKVLEGDVKTLLARTDRLAWETDVLGDDERAGLVAYLREHSISFEGPSAPRTTLERLFFETLESDAGHGGGVST